MAFGFAPSTPGQPIDAPVAPRSVVRIKSTFLMVPVQTVDFIRSTRGVVALSLSRPPDVSFRLVTAQPLLRAAIGGTIQHINLGVSNNKQFLSRNDLRGTSHCN
jgi:hypothetical protein